MVSSLHASSYQRRSAARLAGVQALYALEVAGDNADQVIADAVDGQWLGAETGDQQVPLDERYLQLLVNGVVFHRLAIDKIISRVLTHVWTLARLEVLLRSILRAGVYELAVQTQVPAKVIINEYLQIANGFYSGKEPALVNAVLDHIASHRADIVANFGKHFHV